MKAKRREWLANVRGRKSLVPNTKFKALVLIPSRMDGVGVSACVYARMCVFVCARS